MIPPPIEMSTPQFTITLMIIITGGVVGFYKQFSNMDIRSADKHTIIDKRLQTLEDTTTNLEIYFNGIDDIRRELVHINESLVQIQTTLWGINGENGMRGTIQELKDDVRALRSQHQHIKHINIDEN